MKSTEFITENSITYYHGSMDELPVGTILTPRNNNADIVEWATMSLRGGYGYTAKVNGEIIGGISSTYYVDNSGAAFARNAGRGAVNIEVHYEPSEDQRKEIFKERVKVGSRAEADKVGRKVIKEKALRNLLVSFHLSGKSSAKL